MKSKPLFNAQWTIGILIGVAVFCAIAAVIGTDIFGKKGNRLGREFQYDIEQYQKIDPALLLYEESDVQFDPGIKTPHAIAIGPSDNIYVGGGFELHAFSPSGEKLSFDVKLTEELSALTVSDNGTLYVGLGNHIQVYGPAGEISHWAGPNPKAFITSISVFHHDAFASDFGNREIVHWDATGKVKQTFGEFVIPSPYFDIAVSRDKTIYVCHTGAHRIESFNFEGNLMSWWGAYSIKDAMGFCGCCNPVSIALLPNREGFVTCEKGITRIKIYDIEGNFKGFVAGPEQFAEHAALCGAPDADLNEAGLDVAVDSKGRIVVLDSAVKEIRIFTILEKRIRSF